MKSKTFIIDDLLERCRHTLNKIDVSTLQEAIEFQCYRLDLECIIIEPDYIDSYKRPIAIIPSMKIIDIMDVLENEDLLKHRKIDVLVVPITKKNERNFFNTIGGRVWNVNRFTSMSHCGIAFNNGAFFKNTEKCDLKYTIVTKSINDGESIKVTVIKL